MTQTTLASDVFGGPLRRRIARAEAVHEQVRAVYRTLHDACPGEWQLVALDRPAHYATRALHHAQDDERYTSYIEQAEASLEGAEWVVAGIIEACEDEEVGVIQTDDDGGNADA